MISLPLAAMTCGAIAGASIGLLIRELAPRPPKLTVAMARLDIRTLPGSRTEQASSARSLLQRVGAWLEHHIGGSWFAPIPAKDLALLGQSHRWFFERKVIGALAGLAISAALGLLVTVTNFPVPLVVPAGFGVAMAAALWFVPDLEARGKAQEARVEMRRALRVYFFLVSLERTAGSGVVESLTKPAERGDSPVFRRLRDELFRADLNGIPAWEALRILSRRVDVHELADLADIMSLAGEQSADSRERLRASAKSLGVALMAQEQAQANANTTRMVLPNTVLFFVASLLLLYPGLRQLFVL